MAFTNDAEFEDDFRKVGADVTAGFERPGMPANPTETASSENLEVAPELDTKSDTLDEDEDEDEDDDELGDEDELEDDEDEELEDEDPDGEDDELEDDDEVGDDDEDEDEDEELEDDDDTVVSRNEDALTVARKK